jgi:phage terminase small subunit
MRGRKPKPTVLHHLQGTFNPTDHRNREREAVAIGDLLTPPRDLSPAQAATWRYAIKHAPATVLKQIDREILRAWCETVERHHEAQLLLDAELENEAWVKSPCHRILDRTTMLLVRLAGELGFSPAARPRILIDSGAESASPGTGNPWRGSLRLVGDGD